MTRAQKILSDAVLDSSLRVVAKEVGVSHQTLSDFLDDPDKASGRTKEKVRRWMAKREPDAERPPDVDRKAAAFDLVMELAELISDETGPPLQVESSDEEMARRSARADILRSLLDQTG